MVVAYISCFIFPTTKNQQNVCTSTEKILVVTNLDSSDSNKTDNNCIDFYLNLQAINNDASIQTFKRNNVVTICHSQLFQLSDKTLRFHFSRPPPTFS